MTFFYRYFVPLYPHQLTEKDNKLYDLVGDPENRFSCNEAHYYISFDICLIQRDWSEHLTFKFSNFIYSTFQSDMG